MKFFFKLGGEGLGEGIKNSVEKDITLGLGIVFFFTLFVFKILTVICEWKAKKDYKQHLQGQGYTIDKDTASKDGEVFKIVRADDSFFKPQYKLQ